MAKDIFKHILLSLAFITAFSLWSFAANASETAESPVIEWSSINGDPSILSEYPVLTSTSDGGYVAARTILTSDYHTFIYVVKSASNGTIIWEQKIDTVNDDINFYSITETSDGGILIGGNVIDTSLSQSLLYLIKLHSDGTTDWSRKYPEYSSNGNNLTGDAILETSSGDLFITGYIHNRSGNASAYVLKINSIGDPYWYRSYRFGDSQYFRLLASTPDDGVIAGGMVTPKNTLGQNSVIYAKINAHGELVWEQLYTTNYTAKDLHAIQASDDGGYVIAGSTLSQEVSGRNYFLQKIDSDGNLLWDKTLHSVPDYHSYDYYFNIEAIQDGYAVIGFNSQGDYPTHTDQHKIIITDKNGEINKTYFLRYPDLFFAKGGKATPEGGFVVVGEIKKNNNYYMQLTKIAGPGVEPTDPSITKIEFQGPHLEVSVGQTINSVVNAVYSNNSVTDVTYSAVYKSLNPDIANVDSQGQITGISPGTTLITASYDGHLASVEVEVKEDPSISGQFFLDSKDYSLLVGTELDVAAFHKDILGNTSAVTRETTFSSDDPHIAIVDEYGNIQGLNPGETFITASYKGLTYRASVWVVRAYVPYAP